MPKISAPTVAEHRLAQRHALISAAEGIIAEEGIAGISPRSVCERAGLTRSAFYLYFPSKDDLLAAIALQAFEAWGAELDAALAAVEPGPSRLHTYVSATIRMAADGKHSLATELQHADLAPKSFEAIMVMHDLLVTPLRTVMEDLGVPNPPARAALVQGLINAGMQLVDHGVSAEEAIESVIQILERGIYA